MPTSVRAFTRLRHALPALPLALLAAAAHSQDARPQQWQSGEQVYAKVCHYCHDAGVGPVILGRKLPPEFVALMVRRGLRAMPAFPASFIDDKALQELGRFIQQSPPAAAAPRRSAQVTDPMSAAPDTTAPAAPVTAPPLDTTAPAASSTMPVFAPPTSPLAPVAPAVVPGAATAAPPMAPAVPPAAPAATAPGTPPAPPDPPTAAPPVMPATPGVSPATTAPAIPGRSLP